MGGWSAADVLRAAQEWVWVPDKAKQLLTEEYQLVAYPERFSVPAQVAWCRSDRPAAELFDEVTRQVAAWGKTEFGWWITGATRPSDMEAHLRAAGATLRETVDVLARELSGDLPDLAYPDGVSVEIVHDERTLRAANRVVLDVWNDKEPDDEEFATQMEELAVPLQERAAFRVVAYVDGEPAATGGCTRTGPVARLWGGATIDSLRGRGAYRATLAARLREARELGSTLALSKGRVRTSAPILRKAGFDVFGQEHFYLVDVAE